MFNFIKRIIGIPDLDKLVEVEGSGFLKDPDFGLIRYVEASDDEEGFWQMDDDWDLPEEKAKVSCCVIPGDINGPFVEARQFLLLKKENLSKLWLLCEDELHEQIKVWYPNDIGRPPQDIFFIASLALDGVKQNSNGWEVSFESRDDFRWTFMSFQFQGNELVSGSVDT
jgi:hypothetical protein